MKIIKNNFFKILIGFFIICFPFFGNSQVESCIDKIENNLGIFDLYSAKLEEEACNLIDAINNLNRINSKSEFRNSTTFNIHFYDLYRLHAFKNEREGYEHIIPLIENEFNSGTSSGIFLIRWIISDAVFYKILLKLPNEPAFSQLSVFHIDRIINELEKEVPQGMIQNSAEHSANMLIKLKDFFNGDFEIEDPYTFESQTIIPIPNNNSFQPVIIDGLITDFIITDGQSTVQMSSVIPNEFTLATGTINIPITFLITSNLLEIDIEKQNIKIINYLEDVEIRDEIGIHLHYKKDDINGSELHVKTDVNLENAEYIADAVFTREMSNWGVGITTTGKTRDDAVSTRNDDVKWAEKYLTQIATDFPNYSSSAHYGIAIGCGLVDGLLGMLKSLYELGKGGANVLYDFFIQPYVDIYNFFEDWIEKESLTQVIIDNFNEEKEELIKVIDNFKDAWVIMKKLYEEANLTDIINAIYDKLVIWFESFTDGTLQSAYNIGTLLFDVIFTVATLGGGSAAIGAKFLAKAAKYFKGGGQAIANLSRFVDDILATANRTAAVAKKVLRCKILGKGCFVADTPVLMAGNSFKNVAPAMALAAMPLVAPIQNVQVDDMVKAYHHEDMYLMASNDADDIYVPGWQDYDYLDITPETWQVGKFIIVEDDGSLVEIEANRPKQWFKDQGVTEIGNSTFLIMEEFGVFGNAELLELKPTYIDTRTFKLNESGKVDRPVITTFKRIAQEISDYTFSNGQVISCTPNHPFYSYDHQAYIPIGELTFGETVQTAGERAVKFIGGKSREKDEHVYNFEVWREHNYYVGSKESGEFLLVHNVCWKQVVDFINDPKRFDKIADWWDTSFPAFFERGHFFEQVMRQKKFKDWKYTGKGFDQNGIKIQGDGISNYQAVDFYKGDVVASMKSTKYANPSDWLNASYNGVEKNKKHIRDLLEGLENKKFPQYPNAPDTKSILGVNKAELHVFRPDMNGFSEQDWLNSIKSFAASEGYSQSTIDKLKVFVSRMEDHL